MPRIAVAGFQHETNSFTEHRADFDYFCLHRDRPPLVRGDGMIEALRHGSYGLSGFLDAVAPDWQILPLVWASGGAGGPVTDDAFERIVGEMMDRLASAGPVDGVYLDLHGAMVTESLDDAEGDMLRRTRTIVGPRVPIVVSLDYHANISLAMVQLTDGMVVFRTYPHVDRPETGARAARILARLLREGLPSGRALRKTPFLLPIDFQCTLVEPSRSIVEWTPCADSAWSDVINASYAAGFPPSDTSACGPAVVVHARTQEQADRVADAYLDFVLQRETAFAAEFWPLASGLDEALRRARSAQRPVVIADTQDNPGAGGSGNTTGILRALHARDASGALLGYFFDAEAARRACHAGAGAQVRLSLGANTNGAEAFEADFEVVRCASGPFRYTGPVAGNVLADLGDMALLRMGGIEIAITSRNVQAYDAAPFERLGADPAAARILVLKSSCHFHAVFGPMADSVMTVLSPGAYQPDPTACTYQHLRPGVRRMPSSR
ncbi:M81 family metallopeptidase [Hydrogenophaga sp.]|uniref:M81 family metallopeptidase n=1 Tax=Hydrogenophaga sp. TaxID=1904254 RepID=UPI00271DEB9F|nr:M81 family metallopeptidase [Hydrogenophaga sp.]MDO9436524.1 M81 family metallopeptidase [Hydrogenophaga sp.]